MTKLKVMWRGLDKVTFRVAYSNLPICFRNKPCGLTWTEVYELLEGERE